MKNAKHMFIAWLTVKRFVDAIIQRETNFRVAVFEFIKSMQHQIGVAIKKILSELFIYVFIVSFFLFFFHFI